MKDISGMEKTGTNRAMKYDFITIDDVVNAVRKSFIKHRITFVADTESWEFLENKFYMNLSLTFHNADNPDDKETVRALGISCQMTDTAPGKAIAYAVKNTLLKTLLIPGGKHEDVELEDKPPAPTPAPSVAPVAVPQQTREQKREILMQIKEELSEVMSLAELRSAWTLITREHAKDIQDAAYTYYKKIRESFLTK